MDRGKLILVCLMAIQLTASSFFLATDDRERGERDRRAILRAVADTPEQVDAAGQYFYEMTRTLIDRRSYSLVGGKVKSIDIVRDVLKAVPIHWVATQVVRRTLFPLLQVVINLTWSGRHRSEGKP
jgi:hypothetical protein